MRYILQMKIKKMFKTQRAFSAETKISEPRLSALIHGDRLMGREKKAITDALEDTIKLFHNSKDN